MFIETIGWQATQPNTGLAAAAFTGDSLTVKNGTPGSQIVLLTALALQQVAGYQQITAPSFNDTTRGIRYGVPAATPGHYLPLMQGQPLKAQETLSVTIAGSNTAGDIELGGAMIYYENLPGQQGTYLTEDEMYARAVRMVTVYATISTGTAGGWSGGELITAESDLLRANRDYAVLGITSIVACLAVGMRAPDWSNGRIAVPGQITNPELSSEYFRYLSWDTGLPCIPVFNSANKNNIFLDAAVDENGADPIVSVMLMELES